MSATFSTLVNQKHHSTLGSITTKKMSKIPTQYQLANISTGTKKGRLEQPETFFFIVDIFTKSTFFQKLTITSKNNYHTWEIKWKWKTRVKYMHTLQSHFQLAVWPNIKSKKTTYFQMTFQIALNSFSTVKSPATVFTKNWKQICRELLKRTSS